MQMNRFNYVKYDDKSTSLSETIKSHFEILEDQVSHLSEGRAKALALTKLEEAYMWCGKAIRDAQVARGGDALHIAERTSE